MKQIKDKTKNTKKDFSPKDAILVFSSFTLICVAIIFILMVYDALAIQNFLSFDKPIRMVMNIVVASFGLLLFGVILTLYIPLKRNKHELSKLFTVKYFCFFVFRSVI